MNIKAVKNSVVVKKLESVKQTDSGIILKRSLEFDKCEVLSVGSLVEDIVVGDVLLVNWNKASKLVDDLYSIKYDDVVAVVVS